MKKNMSKIIRVINRIALDFILLFVFGFISMMIRHSINNKIEDYIKINHEPAPMWLKGMQYFVLAWIIFLVILFILSVRRNILKAIKYDISDPNYYRINIIRIVASSILGNIDIIFKAILKEAVLLFFIFAFANGIEHHPAVLGTIIAFLVICMLVILGNFIKEMIDKVNLLKQEVEVEAQIEAQNNSTFIE